MSADTLAITGIFDLGKTTLYPVKTGDAPVLERVLSAHEGGASDD